MNSSRGYLKRVRFLQTDNPDGNDNSANQADPPIVPDETSDATSDQTDPPDDRTTAPQEVISERKLSQIFGKDFHAATNLDEFKQVFSEVDGGYIFNPAITTKGDLDALLDKMPNKIKDHSRGIKGLWDIIYL